jgi:hypothetical protein
MKRGKKLILLAAVLALAVAGVLIVQAVVSRNEEATTEAEDTSVTFLTVDPDKITALAWTYEGETVNLAYADGVWTNADDGAFPVAQTYPDAMATALEAVTASRSFDAGDLSEYGLDAPAYTVTVTADTATTLTIGNATELSGEYYASIGDGKVYLVASDLLDLFKYGLNDVLQMEAIPDMSALNGLDITTKTGETNILYQENSDYSYTDQYHWLLLQNGSYQALGSAADTFADSLKALSWISCENYNATDEDLAAYGLDDPNATMILSYTEAASADGSTETASADSSAETASADGSAETAQATFVLEIGGFTDGGYYARIQGSRMVYLIDATLAQSILNASYDTLKPTDVCLLDWDTVTSFDVTLDGAAYTFARNTRDVTDADGNVTQETYFTMNGAEVNADLVTAIFDSIYGMASNGATDQAPGAVEIAFAFHRNTATFSDIDLVFYRSNSTSCIVGMGGETGLTVARGDVVALIENVNAILLDPPAAEATAEPETTAAPEATAATEAEPTATPETGAASGN